MLRRVFDAFATISYFTAPFSQRFSRGCPSGPELHGRTGHSSFVAPSPPHAPRGCPLRQCWEPTGHPTPVVAPPTLSKTARPNEASSSAYHSHRLSDTRGGPHATVAGHRTAHPPEEAVTPLGPGTWRTPTIAHCLPLTVPCSRTPEPGSLLDALKPLKPAAVSSSRLVTAALHSRL
jgi:hypothetical protein